MLYITTRDNRDAVTAYKTLHTDFGVEGGAYVPFRMPVFTKEKLEMLVQGSFSETVAEILNCFFSCKITGWDVDFCVGRNAVKTKAMPHRLVVAELWHNPVGTYDSAIFELYKKLAESNFGQMTEWYLVASRIAVLFGIYTQMRKDNVIGQDDTFDISLPSDNFDIPAAAYYAREMGLPIDMIVCVGGETSVAWDYIHLGELNTASVSGTIIGFERYVYSKLGEDSVKLLIDAHSKKRTFRVPEEKLSEFNKGMFCATAGKNRSLQTINSIFRSNNYLMDSNAALCVGGLQDYRAKSGESKLTLVLSEVSPLLKAKEIAEATGISEGKIADYL